MSLADRQRSLIEDLAIIEDAQERLAVIVDQGRRSPALPLEEKTERNRVTACVSAVWITGVTTAGRIHFRCEAESPLVKGLVALICSVYDGGTPAEIIATEPTILEDLHLAQDLSPTRRNGLAAVRARIRLIAETSS